MIAAYYLIPATGLTRVIFVVSVNASGAIAAAGAARRRSAQRGVWVPLACAMSFATLANLFYYGFPLVEHRALPFPSVVDVLWLATYPAFIVSLVNLAGRRLRRDILGDALDTAIIVAGGGTVLWVYVIWPAVHSTGLGLFAHAVSVTYPTMDLLVFAMFIRMALTITKRSPAVNLQMASYLCLLIADTLYATELQGGTYHFGGPPDGVWMASYALIAASALHLSRNDAPKRITTGHISRMRLVVLALSVLVGPSVIAAPTLRRRYRCQCLRSGLCAGHGKDHWAQPPPRRVGQRAREARVDGLADRARQPVGSRDPVGGRASSHPLPWDASRRCCSSTSTTSRRSTTLSGTKAVTPRCVSQPPACGRRHGSRT